MDFIAECHTWSRLRHPNIVQFLGVVFEEGSTLPILVLEILPASLRIHLETSSKSEFLIEQKIKVLHHVALGLAYLHGQNQVHRDLSTNNILLHPEHGTAKITDFGVTRAISSGRERQTGSAIVPGTLAFMPPEVFDMPPRYNDRADVFSFGCVILSILSHEWPQPLAAKTRRDGHLVALSELERRQHCFNKIEQGEVSIFNSLIELCLEEEPDGRPDSLSIAKDLDDLRECYNGPTLREKVLELEAKVRSLEERVSDLGAKNEKLMQANISLNEEKASLPQGCTECERSSRRDEWSPGREHASGSVGQATAGVGILGKGASSGGVQGKTVLQSSHGRMDHTQYRHPSTPVSSAFRCSTGYSRDSLPHDASKERFLPLDQWNDSLESSSQPRSECVGRMPLRNTEYECSSRRDEWSPGMGHSSGEVCQPSAGGGAKERGHSSGGVGQLTAGGGAKERGHLSRRVGQPTADGEVMGREASSRGVQGKTMPQNTHGRMDHIQHQHPPKPVSSASRSSTGYSRSIDSTAMAAVFNHTHY